MSVSRSRLHIQRSSTSPCAASYRIPRFERRRSFELAQTPFGVAAVDRAGPGFSRIVARRVPCECQRGLVLIELIEETLIEQRCVSEREREREKDEPSLPRVNPWKG